MRPVCVCVGVPVENMVRRELQILEPALVAQRQLCVCVCVCVCVCRKLQ